MAIYVVYENSNLSVVMGKNTDLKNARWAKQLDEKWKKKKATTINDKYLCERMAILRANF